MSLFLGIILFVIFILIYFDADDRRGNVYRYRRSFHSSSLALKSLYFLQAAKPASQNGILLGLGAGKSEGEHLT